MRDAGLTPMQVPMVYTRYQDAVPFFVENNLTLSGATASSSVIKACSPTTPRISSGSQLPRTDKPSSAPA